MDGETASASGRGKVASLLGLAVAAAVLAAAYHSGWQPHLPALLKNATPVQAQAPTAPAAPARPTSPGTLKIDDDDQERGGIEAATPKEIAYQEQVRAFGIILPLERMVTLYNGAIAAEQQLKAANVKLAASQTANQRAQKLLKVFPSAAAQAEAAEAAVGIDGAAAETAKAQVEAVRTSALQDWGPVLGGAIASRTEPALSLVARKTCLVQLTLQPGADLAAPQRVTLTLGNGETATADLVSAATQADPRLAGASYLYTTAVTASTLTGATVSASFAKGEATPSIVIPPSAVVWLGGRPWLYVKTSAENFERKPIDADAIAAADGSYIVPAGHWPKDRSIVVAGAQALLSEETKSQRSDEDND